MLLALWAAAFFLAITGTATQSASAQPSSNPTKLLQEADRLSWLRAWSTAEPLYTEAEKLFAARGDERNALYARISALRGQLPRLPVSEVSASLAAHLENPLVQSDDGLRLRCLIIKGETDQDLDPSMAAESWRQALLIAEKLGDAAWANRARGELGLVAFLQGDVGGAVIGLGQSLKAAQGNGDVSSVVRWLTLFGHGYVQLGRPQEALDFYDRALKVASTVPELQFPVMTYVGRSNALIKLGRGDEADEILKQAEAVAAKHKARGYQAQLLTQRALVAHQRAQPEQALALLSRASDLARVAGANRIVAEIALDAAKIQRARNHRVAAERTLREGIQVARKMEERLLLPRLLGELADLKTSQRRFVEAAPLLEESTELLDGLFTTSSSPWLQSRLISGMDDVFLARIRLEGQRGSPSRMFAAIELARGRPLLELLVNRPLSGQLKPEELRDGERKIAVLQRKLLQTADRRERRRLLDQIFDAEEQLAPASTAFFDRSRRGGPRSRIALRDLQRILRADELFLQFALAEPQSYAIVATATTARLQRLAAHSVLRGHVESLLRKLRAGEKVSDDGARLAEALLGSIPELRAKRRLVVSPDRELHNVPFELLDLKEGQTLLESHVVSYVPSGSVLAVLRTEKGVSELPSQSVLAVSASPSNGTAAIPPMKGVSRSVYDVDPTKLRPLPAADDEARSVGSILGSDTSTVLLGERATEAEFKRQPLALFDVVHFAVHGVPSTKFPARAALLLHPGGNDDGVLQAREILTLALNATLVTLSACETSSGSVHGQDGAASLVRPFIAAGARSVVANLWAADDTFSLNMMREFYRRLAAGSDVATAIRHTKLQMIKSFGPEAVPRLWSGVLVYGDGAATISALDATARKER